jgi:AraC-like DNA-binding protein
VIGSPLHESTGRLVNLADLVGRAADELGQRCVDLPNAESRVRCAERWISARIARSRAIDPRVAWSAARIERSNGVVAIARLQEQTGLSKKRLIQGFREQIGVTPKLYARIIRFRRAVTLLHEGGSSPAEIAVDVGYYDQPHMNLDFRELAGLAPGDFLAATRYSPTTIAS